MIYELSNSFDVESAKQKFSEYLEGKRNIKLEVVKARRSIRQNAYLHVLITLFAIHFGYTLEEAKTLLKRECEFMVYEKNGFKFLKKTSMMDSKELTDFIEWIRNYAGKNGLNLPSSDDYITHQIEIDKEMNKNKSYL